LNGVPLAARIAQPAKSAFLEGRRPFRVALDIWPWLVALAALLVVPEIALRRADLGAWLRRRRTPDRS